MVISYYGLSCFRVQFGDLVVALNPPSKESAHKTARFGADVVFITNAHADMNGAEQAALGDRQPFVVSGPGEYELKGLTARGFATETQYGLPAVPARAGQAGGEKRNHTVYKITLEGMTLAFLGALSSPLTPAAKSALEDADILFVPIGGAGTLDVAGAHHLAVSLEPRLIIPMLLGTDGKAFTQFLKECGTEGTKPVDKLTLKKKDLEGKAGEVAVLAPQG